MALGLCGLLVVLVHAFWKDGLRLWALHSPQAMLFPECSLTLTHTDFQLSAVSQLRLAREGVFQADLDGVLGCD